LFFQTNLCSLKERRTLLEINIGLTSPPSKYMFTNNYINVPVLLCHTLNSSQSGYRLLDLDKAIAHRFVHDVYSNNEFTGDNKKGNP
jgi:hypothetical protein